MINMIKFEKDKGFAGQMLPLAAATMGLLLLTGCASTPQPPTQALQAAEMAITTAEQARVADYASPELGAARQNSQRPTMPCTKKIWCWPNVSPSRRALKPILLPPRPLLAKPRPSTTK